MITVVPSSRLILRIVARNSLAAIGSSCEVGSSSTSTFGCIAITEARFKSCFCPPDSSSTFFANQFWMPKKLAISATRSRIVCWSYPRFSSPNASSCHTLSVTIWLSGLWRTYPISLACVLTDTCSKASPQNRISPLLVPYGVSAVLKCRSNVVFPQPDFPQMTINSPCSIATFTSCKAGVFASG